jgi:hypothetical protein
VFLFIETLKKKFSTGDKNIVNYCADLNIAEQGFSSFGGNTVLGRIQDLCKFGFRA